MEKKEIENIETEKVVENIAGRVAFEKAIFEGRFAMSTVEDVLRYLSPHPQNRKSKPKHITELERTIVDDFIAKGRLFATVAIITYNIRTNHIIDGEHRYWSMSHAYGTGKLKGETPCPLLCIDVPEDDELSIITKMNNGNDNWTIDNFLECHMIEPEVKKIHDFGCGCEICLDVNKKLKPRTLSTLLMFKGKKSLEASIRKTATVEIGLTDEDFAYAKKLANEAEIVGRWLGVTTSYNSPLISSWREIRNSHSNLNFETDWLPALIATTDQNKKMPTVNKKQITACLNTVLAYATATNRRKRK